MKSSINLFRLFVVRALYSIAYINIKERKIKNCKTFCFLLILNIYGVC